MCLLSRVLRVTRVVLQDRTGALRRFATSDDSEQPRRQQIVFWAGTNTKQRSLGCPTRNRRLEGRSTHTPRTVGRRAWHFRLSETLTKIVCFGVPMHKCNWCFPFASVHFRALSTQNAACEQRQQRHDRDQDGVPRFLVKEIILIAQKNRKSQSLCPMSTEYFYSVNQACFWQI